MVRGTMASNFSGRLAAGPSGGRDGLRLAWLASLRFKGAMRGSSSDADPSDAEPGGPDRELLADIRLVANDRDRTAFARLHMYYAPRVKSYLRRIGSPDDVAEDLVQEVMIAVWRRAHQFDPARAALSTWVYTIARNKRIDAFRRESHPDVDLTDPSMEPPPAPRGDVQVEAAVVKEGIRRAIEHLPPEQADLLRIFYFEDKTHSAIADELGLPLGTVKSRLRLAVARLRGLLEGVA
jgi:RNA polymerase sigma-70 factor (ECF subfamily)